MLDIKWIRENPGEFDRALVRRNLPKQSKEVLALDSDKRQLTTLIQELQHSRKEKSKSLGMVKDKSSSEFERVKRDVEHINQKLEELTTQAENNNQLDAILNSLPNIPFDEVPFGIDEHSNQLIKTVGEPTKIQNPKQHFDLGENLGMIDFAQTTKMSGSRFVSLKGPIARLERALANFMLDNHTKEYGYLEVSPPSLVKSHAMYNVGQLPKFEVDLFKTKRLISSMPLIRVINITGIIKFMNNIENPVTIGIIIA